MLARFIGSSAFRGVQMARSFVPMTTAAFQIMPQRFCSSAVKPPLFDSEREVLTPEEEAQKAQLIKELTRRLAGPLADENGNVPTGADRPTAIEVDGPSHFYANTTKYTSYTKLKHRLLTRMGYRVLHIPYFEWRRLRGLREREEYLRLKLQEEPTEWLDPEDEAYYNQRLDYLEKQQQKLQDVVNHNANTNNTTSSN